MAVQPAEAVAARVCPCQHSGGPHEPALRVECAYTLDLVTAVLAEVAA